MIVDINKLSIWPGRKWPKALENNPRLRASLVKHGQLVPVMVNEEYQILDGASRYIEAKALGWTEIVVAIPENFDGACAIIKQATNTAKDTRQPLTNLRVWEFLQSLDPLFQARLKERLTAMTGRKRGEGYGHRIVQRGPSRDLLAKALGVAGETYLQIFKRLDRLVHDKNHPQHELAKDLWKRMLADEMTPYSAYGVIRRDLEKRKLVSSVVTQRTVLKGVIPVVDALMVSLSDIGDIAEGITAEEATEWADKIAKLKTVLTRTQNKLTNHRLEKENMA